MRKVLVVLRGPVGPTLAERCAEVKNAQVAVCYELPPGADGLREGLVVQRELTAALRQAHGETAEHIPVFVACSRMGERVIDYASAWGATEVRD